MQDSTVLKKNPDIVTRTIEDETILLPLYKSSEGADCIYTLSESAARLWQLIDGKRTLRGIKEVLLDEFSVTEKKLDKELMKLLKDLEEIRAIR